MKYLSIALLLCYTLGVLAQDNIPIIITLKAGESIPDAEDVVQEAQLSPPPANHIISAFNEFRPAEIKFAVQIRAIGDLKNLIGQKPNWGRSLAERSLLLYYDSSVNITEVESGLNADKYIQSVSIIGEVKLAASAHTSNKKSNKLGSDDWHLTAVNWYAANSLVDGFGNIGYVDTGSLNDRYEFAPFDVNTGDFIGGGLNESKSFSRFYEDRKVSELRPIDENDLFGSPGLCDDNDNNPGDGVVYPDAEFVGHGTHVSGLMASRSIDIPGICQSCNIYATQEVKHRCAFNSSTQEYQIKPIIDIIQYVQSLQYLIDSGVQTVSVSLGQGNFAGDICFPNPLYYACSVINDAKARNVAIVAAAGNDREKMRFPAFHRDVIGVSGIQSDLLFWNESPSGGSNFPPLDPMATQDETNCPSFFSNSDECGSNFSWLDNDTPDPDDVSLYQRVDVSAPAREVMSTLPLGSEYNPFIGDAGCTDIADGIIDGYGPCTGTSMATPIVAGILQMIRSVNPLLPIGDDDPTTLDGIRDILLFSGSEFQSTGQHNAWLGFGIPDTELAIKTTLGKSNNLQVKNRVTPLMVLQNEDFDDTLYTVFPQISLAYALEPSGFYENPQNIPAVSELGIYPVEEVDGSPLINLVPLASIYVFTTQWNPLTTNYDLDPLYRMEKEVVSQPNCIPGLNVPVPCQITDRTTVMVTDENELETFYSQGYELQGIEGYVIPCADSSCPTGPASQIYRVHDTNLDKYYLTQLQPGQGIIYEIIGAAFLNFDGDSDGLTVGMEYLLGTNDLNNDSDGDDIPDGTEYPAAGVPFSDPLVSDIIFETGFE